MAILLSFNFATGQNTALFNGSSGPFSNSFLKTNVFPTSTLTSAMFQVGFNYNYRLNRAIIYGGNLGVSQEQNTYGNYLGKWSFKGAWKMPADYSWVGNTQYLVLPGLNYLVDYHRWGDYDAHFGLRERATDVGQYFVDPEGNLPPIPPNPQGDIKDAVLSWGHEFDRTDSRFIIQSIEGVDQSTWFPGQMGPYPIAKEHATILTNGNMGLGTPTPNAHFEIRNNASNPNADGLIVSNANGNELLIVKNNGNVGINNNNPQAKLDVLGNVIVKGNLDINGNNSLTNPTLINVNGANVNIRTGTLTGTTNTPVFSINLANTLNILTIRDNGKIYLGGNDLNSNSSGISTFNQRALIIDETTGQIRKTNFEPMNPDNVWEVKYDLNFPQVTQFGNNLSANLPHAYLGTNSFHDIKFMGGGINGFILHGRLAPNMRGYSQFLKPVSMGGYGALNSATRPNPISTCALTIMPTSSTAANYSLICALPNSNDMLRVGLNNSNVAEVNMFDDNYIFQNSSFITGSDIIPKYPLNYLGPGTGINLGSTSFAFNEIWGTGGNISSSDKRLKTNIKPLNLGLETIKKLKTYSYNYKKNITTTHYGFIAQELKELFPNAIVAGEETDSTYLGVRYDEIVPLLTKGIQEQQQIIDTLKQQVSLLIATYKSKESIATNKEQKETLNQSPLLFQNHPNPFNGFTFIDYFLPPNATNAFIRVVDNNGKLIKAFPINTKGYGQVELDCTNISAGTYHYTLLVDTKVIDTKSMIVTASN